MTPSIAEDIQMLANYFLDEVMFATEHPCKKAAERVEVYLSSFKPDHL